MFPLSIFDRNMTALIERCFFKFTKSLAKLIFAKPTQTNPSSKPLTNGNANR